VANRQPILAYAANAIAQTRGTLLVAAPGQEALLAEKWDTMHALIPNAQLLDRAATCALVPALRPELVLGAVYEPDAADMDVDALLQGYLRGLRRAGGCRPAASATRPRWCSMPLAPGPMWWPPWVKPAPPWYAACPCRPTLRPMA